MALAFDLTGLLSEEEIADKLAGISFLPESLPADKVAEILASQVGMRLDIEFGNKPQATLRLAFAENPAPLEPIAKTLLEKALSEHGARLEDFADWNQARGDQEIVFTGELSDSGLRRVLTILSGPVGPWSKPAETTSPENATAEVSQSYFQAVTGYLDDLFVDNVAQPQSLHQVEVWLERYARKIEDLDKSGVDEDVVTFGDQVAIRLREIGTILSRSERRADLRESTMWNGGRSRYGRYGLYGYFEKPHVTRDRELGKSRRNDSWST